MPTSKTLVKILVVVCVFFALNAGLTYILEPYGSKSQVVWADYHKMERMDTVLQGSSYVQAGIDPVVLDERCNTMSYCLGTPHQRLEESFVGIRTAYEDYGIKQVVMGVSPSAVSDPRAPWPDGAYLRQRRQYTNFADAFAIANEMLFHYGAISSEESINFLFPWKSHHVAFTPSNIIDNVKRKVEQVDLGVAVEAAELKWHYMGRGHGMSETYFDQNRVELGSFNHMLESEIDPEKESIVLPERARTIGEMCTYCKEHDIDLVFVSLPMPEYNYAEAESVYFDFIEDVREVLKPYDVPLYDFNCVKDSVFHRIPEYFSDPTHLNGDGCAVFTEVFADFYKRYLAGEDVSDLFTTPEEAVLAVDFVSAILAETKATDEGVQVSCHVAASPEVDVEYCLYMKEKADSDDWVRVCDWSRNPEMMYKPDHRGTVYLRAAARKVGNTTDSDRYRDLTVMY